MEGRNGNTVLLTVIGVATLLVALVGATFAYFTATVENSASQSISIVTATPVALTTGNDAVISIPNATPGDQKTGQKFTVTNPAEGNTAMVQSYDLHFIADVDNFVTTCKTGVARKTDVALGITAGTAYTCTTAIENAFADQLELTITQTTSEGGSALKITDANDGANGTMSKSSNAAVWNLTNGSTVQGQSYQVVNDQPIKPGETQTYTMDLNFKELDLDQTDNASTTGVGAKTVTFIGHLQLDDAKVLSAQ